MVFRRAKTPLLVVALAASMGVGVLAGFWMPDDDLFEMRRSFRIFSAAFEEVVTGYVEPVDPGHLMRVGMDAMLDELDPYTVFMDESENVRLDIITEGLYGGVGLEIGRRGGDITVVAPVRSASGYEKGIRTGDVLTTVAGQSTDGLSVEDVKALLRGEPGTTVQVTVERAGAAAPLTFALTREQVELPDVAYRGRVGEANEIGYVKLERFTREAPQSVEDALKALQERGPLRGVVLDVRDNPGGLLRSAVGVTALFVSQGAEVVSTRGRGDGGGRTYRNNRVPLLPDVPLVILVNGQSASASEIVAGAIQDHDRGVIMGTQSYGKGLVQNLRSLPHNTSLKITTAQYYTPSGRTIENLDGDGGDSTAARSRVHETKRGRTVRDRDGIRPDIRVDADSSSALEAALRRQAAFFRYANHYAASHDTITAAFSVTDEDLRDFREWLDAKAIPYPTKAERSLDSLRALIGPPASADVQNAASALDVALREAKAASFERHATTLKRHLKREILARYLDADRQVAALLPKDRQVNAATVVLNDSERYEDVLTPED